MFHYCLLRELRLKKGLRPTELVLELDKKGLRISRPTLLNWEKGYTEPKISQLYLISKFFDVKIEDFIEMSKTEGRR